MTDWYAFRPPRNDAAEVLIYDRIGTGFFDEGIEAKTFVAEFGKITAGAITVRINSPGGSVFDGQAIAAAIARHPAVITAHIDGLAASIATVIALAADRVVMSDNALFMIHDPRIMADGTAADMRSAAELLDRITAGIVAAYVGKTGQGEVDVRAAMAAETWYTADEAFALGYVDQVQHVVGTAAACASLAEFGYRNIPTPSPALAVATTERETMETDTLPPVVVTGYDLTGYATTEDVAALARQIAASTDLAPTGDAHPLAQYRSLGDYTLAVFHGAAPVNVIADQITTNNPGVMPPNWASEVKNIVEWGRPAITALGGPESAGDSGLDFAWPYFDGDLAAIVAEQVAQKTDVNSVRIDLKKGTATLKTYAAASDISYQLLMRSQPSYLDAHNRIMAAGFAITTDNVFADALLAGATASAVDYDLAADTDGKKFRAAIFAASSEVADATGAPATAVLVAPDVFAKIGGWDAFVPAPYGTQNVPGTATASTLRVEVSGLPVVRDKNLAAGSIIATNPTAARWIEDGPAFADANTPTKLGRDVAIFGFGCTAIYNAKGVVKVTNLP